jgi:hypothetical protein
MGCWPVQERTHLERKDGDEGMKRMKDEEWRGKKGEGSVVHGTVCRADVRDGVSHATNES